MILIYRPTGGTPLTLTPTPTRTTTTGWIPSDNVPTSLRSIYVVLYTSSLPTHQDQRNPMWFARSPQQEFLFLPPKRPSLSSPVLLRHRVRDRRNQPAVF